MRAAIADAVNAVLERGLSLRARLEAGEKLLWDAERGAIEQRIGFFDAGEDVSRSEADLAVVSFDPTDAVERDRLTRATIRVALTCWLDEWLRNDSAQGSPSSERWSAAAVGPLPAATKFWDEARYAETRADLDALEVMHLCVMLGYRGVCRDNPDQLETWCARIGKKLDEVTLPWAMPACLTLPRETPTNDTPLRRMAFSLLLTIALLTPWIAMLRWRF